MFELQPWHINNGQILMLEPGRGELDWARGYYDPDNQEAVIVIEARDTVTGHLDPYIDRIVLRLLHEKWPTAEVRRE